MNRKEYLEKQEKYNAAVKEIRQKQIDLDKAYADDLAKLNGLKKGDTIKDRSGRQFSFSEIQIQGSHYFVMGREIKKDGTLSAFQFIVWGYKLKEE